MKKRLRQNRRVERKKKTFFKKHYSLSWQFIKECKSHILFVLILFLFAFLIALYYQPPEVVELMKQFIEDLLQKTEGLNAWQMILFIFNNNLRSSFIVMVAGIFFGIFPVFTALANGYVLGFVAEKSVAVEGLDVLLRLFPHGIFELPAIILALALGVRLGTFWFAEEKKKEFIRRLENSLRVFIFIILPLLVIAAIIEGILIFVW